MSKHIWKPTTETKAVWKCSKCDLVGFGPHPLPEEGCGVLSRTDHNPGGTSDDK